jgi:hypothetical protein
MVASVPCMGWDRLVGAAKVSTNIGGTAMDRKLKVVVGVVLVSALLAGCAPDATPTPPPASKPAATPTTGRTTWSRTFAGPDYGAFFDLALTPDGGLLAVGATNHLHAPPYSGDALFMKLTPQGEVVWEKRWGGEGFEQAITVVPDEDGGFYIFGETDSYGAGDRDFFLLRLTADGNEDWFRTYGKEWREWPYGMLRLANGDLLIHGFTETKAGGGRSQYALRLTSDGDILWEYVGEGAGEQIVLDALETPEGHLVLAVLVEEDGGLVQLDADGKILWSKRYELAGWQFASQIAEADGGGFFLVGFSMSDSPRQADTWLARATSAGDLEWQTAFGDPSSDDYATSMIRLHDGSYLLGAIANGVVLSRVDGDGEVVWRRFLVGESVYGAMGLLELADGGYMVAGLSQLVNGRSYDAVILRTDSEGRLDG